MASATFEDHPTDPDKVILRKPRHEDDDDIQEYKKPWVGLTDEEVEGYWDWEDFQCGAGRSTILEMVRDIEAKLKERNT
jgi:hypothetical protein